MNWENVHQGVINSYAKFDECAPHYTNYIDVLVRVVLGGHTFGENMQIWRKYLPKHAFDLLKDISATTNNSGPLHYVMWTQ